MSLFQRLYFFVYFIAIVLINGCAYTDARVNLTYEPVTVLSRADHYSDRVLVQKFEDIRINKKIIGEVRNLKGKKTADVLIDKGDPSSWITDALIKELKKSGLDVMPTVNIDNNANSLMISGAISELFISVNLDFMYRCTVRANIQVMRNSNFLLDKNFVGKGEAEAKWGYAEERETAVKSSLQNLMKRAIPEIMEAIR